MEYGGIDEYAQAMVRNAVIIRADGCKIVDGVAIYLERMEFTPHTDNACIIMDICCMANDVVNANVEVTDDEQEFVLGVAGKACGVKHIVILQDNAKAHCVHFVMEFKGIGGLDFSKKYGFRWTKQRHGLVGK